MLRHVAMRHVYNIRCNSDHVPSVCMSRSVFGMFVLNERGTGHAGRIANGQRYVGDRESHMAEVNFWHISLLC